jgi:cobalt/nickel transport system permease protein
MLPEWFEDNRTAVYEPDPKLEGRKVRLPFLDRTLKAMAGLMEEYLFFDDFAKRNGILQGLDARAKLIGSMILVVVVTAVHSLPIVYGLYGLTFLLACLSKIHPGFFLRRVWLAIPFFVGVIAFPASLNVFTPGEIVIPLYAMRDSIRIGPYLIPAQIGFSAQGISTALLLIGRVAGSMSLVLLLTLTTPWTELLKALRSVRVPRIYVQTLGMAFRYLLLLSQLVRETYAAKKSRTLRPGPTRNEQRWIAGQLGVLFRRSMQLSMDVHQAMVARGFQGEIHLLSASRMRRRDYAWLALCAAIFTGLLCLDRWNNIRLPG